MRHVTDKQLVNKCVVLLGVARQWLVYSGVTTNWRWLRIRGTAGVGTQTRTACILSYFCNTVLYTNSLMVTNEIAVVSDSGEIIMC